MKSFKPAIILPLSFSVVLIILWFFRSQPPKHNTHKDHGSVSKPIQSKENKKTDQNQEAPLKVNSKPVKALDEVSHTPINDIRTFLKNYYPDLIYETTENCPDSLVYSKYWSENTTIDSECSSTLKLTEEYEFVSRHNYINGKLTEYLESVDAVEPVNIKFDSIYEIVEFNLWFQGAVVFGVQFENNLVLTYHKNKDYLLDLEFVLNSTNPEEREPRFEILRKGKKKMETFLYQLCTSTNHQKTCQAHSALAQFDYLSIEKF
ncbi:MAG: hypothetical protein ACJAT2_000936 [Bacteriovoracaceae bacterium]|jgi:hypothetical protein